MLGLKKLLPFSNKNKKSQSKIFSSRFFKVYYKKIKQKLAYKSKDIKVKLQDIPNTNFKLGIYHMKKSNLRDAIFRFKVVLFLRPENIKAKYFLARCYILNDQRDKAIKKFNEISERGVLNEEINYFLNRFENSDSIRIIPKSIMVELCGANFQFYRRDFLNLGYLGHNILVKQALLNIEDKNPNLNVLDLGSGYGHCGLKLKEAGLSKKITGVDLSVFALKQTSGLIRNGEKVYNNVIKTEITEYLASSEEKYDLIIADRSINLTGDLENMARLVKRNLLNKGKFAVIFDKYYLQEIDDIEEGEPESDADKEAESGFVFDPYPQEFLFSDSYIRQIFDIEGFNLDSYKKIEVVSGMKAGLYIFSI